MTATPASTPPAVAGDAPVAARLPDRRRRMRWSVGLSLALLVGVVVAGLFAEAAATDPDLLRRRQPPSLTHPFGTDWLGRDVFARTLVGLRLSVLIGTLAAAVSAVIALVLASAAAALGRRADIVVGWLVDLFLALPHLVLLILVAFAAGRGLQGVTIAVALTHWATLTRVLRGEARAVMTADYTAAAARLGRSGAWIARRHLVRHLLPHFTVGLVLLFPHAILHEAALSFLGFGLPPDTPAIGILLADAMRELSAGTWWLAVLPGLALLAVVKLIDTLGEQARLLLDPRSAHE